MKLKWIGGATTVIEIYGIRIGCDPALCNVGSIIDFGWFRSKRIVEPRYEENDLKRLDVCLFTHNHADHIDEAGTGLLSDSCQLIANKATARTLSKYGFERVIAISWGNSARFEVNGAKITIRAVRTAHGCNHITRLFAGRGNGYHISLCSEKGNFSLYITGDTLFHYKVAQYLPESVDLFIPYLGEVKKGTFIGMMTMDIKMLHSFMKEVKPYLVVPVHYCSFSHMTPPSDNDKAACPEYVIWIEPGDTLIKNVSGLEVNKWRT